MYEQRPFQDSEGAVETAKNIGRKAFGSVTGLNHAKGILKKNKENYKDYKKEQKEKHKKKTKGKQKRVSKKDILMDISRNYNDDRVGTIKNSFSRLFGKRKSKPIRKATKPVEESSDKIKQLLENQEKMLKGLIDIEKKIQSIRKHFDIERDEYQRRRAQEEKNTLDQLDKEEYEE